jgi:hypothetical protein
MARRTQEDADLRVLHIEGASATPLGFFARGAAIVPGDQVAVHYLVEVVDVQDAVGGRMMRKVTGKVASTRIHVGEQAEQVWYDLPDNDQRMTVGDELRRIGRVLGIAFLALVAFFLILAFVGACGAALDGASV